MGEYWNAVCDKPLEVGRKVKVARRRGMVLTVEPLEEGGP
jgi:membrane protein implicated in regulation of membrane protease activity